MELKEFILDKEQPIGLDELLGLISDYFDDDELMSCFRVLTKKKYSDYKFSRFLKWLKNGKIENNQIIHTYYNYSVILFTGCFCNDDKWKSFELRISFSGDMVVEYELDGE